MFYILEKSLKSDISREVSILEIFLEIVDIRPRFSGIWPRFSGYWPRFSGIWLDLAVFRLFWPRFSCI